MFKVGQKVRIKENAEEEFSKSGIFWNDNISQMLGKFCEIKTLWSDRIEIWQEDKKGSWFFPFSAIEPAKPAEKTWETLAKGDVIDCNDDGYIKVVFTANDGVYCLSKCYKLDGEKLDVVDGWFTKSEIIDRGWTIKQPEKPEEVTELTVAECAKRLKIKNLKIVE